MSYDPQTSKTTVVQDGNRWQARYFDSEMRLWFDLGDPRNTEAEARELIENFRKGEDDES